MKTLAIAALGFILSASTSFADAALDRCRNNFDQLGGEYSMAVLEVCARQERAADIEIAKILKSGDQRAIRVCNSMADFESMSHPFWLVCYRNEVAATQRLNPR